MAKMTLLEMTQNILSAMDSDPVNSIDDTVEAVQVADLIKEAYFDIVSGRDWAFLRTLDTLDGIADVSNPTKLRIPNDLQKLLWFKYNGKEIAYLDPDDFDYLIEQREELVDVVDANGFVINRDPIYWTTYDDVFIVCDGYDSTVDTTLQGSKTKVYGVKEPTWTHTDGAYPDMPAKFFPTLLAEAKAQAFVNLKQQPNPREERKAQRGRVRMQNEHWKANDGEVKSNRKVNYGRK